MSRLSIFVHAIKIEKLVWGYKKAAKDMKGYSKKWLFT